MIETCWVLGRSLLGGYKTDFFVYFGAYAIAFSLGFSLDCYNFLADICSFWGDSFVLSILFVYFGAYALTFSVGFSVDCYSFRADTGYFLDA